jgi:hypothetical protein
MTEHQSLVTEIEEIVDRLQQIGENDMGHVTLRAARKYHNAVAMLTAAAAIMDASPSV